MQTGLPSSAPFLVRVLLPIPRRGPARASVLSRRVLPSPGHERLGPRIVSLSRLQASLHVAARVLAPRRAALAVGRAFDTPLGPADLSSKPGVCYPAHRRLPGRDFHPWERCSKNLLRLAPTSVLHGTPRSPAYWAAHMSARVRPVPVCGGVVLRPSRRSYASLSKVSRIHGKRFTRTLNRPSFPEAPNVKTREPWPEGKTPRNRITPRGIIDPKTVLRQRTALARCGDVAVTAWARDPRLDNNKVSRSNTP